MPKFRSSACRFQESRSAKDRREGFPGRGSVGTATEVDSGLDGRESTAVHRSGTKSAAIDRGNEPIGSIVQANVTVSERIRNMFRKGLPASAVVLFLSIAGCTHCDTCDDFPTPCLGPNCGGTGGGSYTAPVAPVNGYAAQPGMSPIDSSNAVAEPAMSVPPSTQPPESSGAYGSVRSALPEGPPSIPAAPTPTPPAVDAPK